ncbi:ABC transporter permease [uncultured Bifidobacterium sp.]|uniref:ABC transporter permease n=1 Tax=uncultured Bifidobacterium sp. TaxID=165187 RepID=UPI0028DC1C5F|nr:ABC transporter permease [uncultured Bifidobacterium sp.]
MRHILPTRRLALRPVAVILSFIVLAGVAVLALIPALSTAGLNQNLLLSSVAPGTQGHVWGTDALGRDVLLLTLAGSRTALAGPVMISCGAMAVGLVLGTAAAWLGGWVDWLVSRVVEVMLSLPTLLIAIVVAGVIGGGYWTNVLVFVILYAPYEIRLVRSGVLAHLHDSYLDAARLLELGPVRIAGRHLLPVIRPLIGAEVFLEMANALISLSSLSFLGLGVSPQDADWGRQLSDARELLFSNPMAAVAPGVAIILTSVAFNVVGDWITERGMKGEI